MCSFLVFTTGCAVQYMAGDDIYVFVFANFANVYLYLCARNRAVTESWAKAMAGMWPIENHDLGDPE